MKLKMPKRYVKEIRYAIMNELLRKEPKQTRYYFILKRSLKKIDKQLNGVTR